MKFKLTPMFTAADIQKETNAFLERVHRLIKSELDYLAMEMVTNAKEKTPDVGYHRDAKDIVVATKLAGGTVNLADAGSFNDQTTALRSSIGYVLMLDGEIINEEFSITGTGPDGAEGMRKGMDAARKATAEHPNGWAVILVAGMEYALWVEAKGYDVISGSTQETETNKKLQKALNNVLKAFN